jgi:hypothetical protein
VHLRLLTAVENNFAGDVMFCNGTVELIFLKTRFLQWNEF